MYVCMYVYIYIYTLYVNTYIYVCIHTYTHMYTYTHIHTHTYIGKLAASDAAANIINGGGGVGGSRGAFAHDRLKDDIDAGGVGRARGLSPHYTGQLPPANPAR